MADHLFEIEVTIPGLGRKDTAYADDAGGCFLAVETLMSESGSKQSARAVVRNLSNGHVIFDGSWRDALRSRS